MAKLRKKLKNYNYVVDRALSMGIREVAVGVSCGRDSVVALDICKQKFPVVKAYFLYVIPGLTFQQKYLDYLSKRYKVEISQFPHFMLSQLFRSTAFRRETRASVEAPRLRPKDVYEFVKRKLGVKWLATGERKADSLERRAQISSVDGVNEKRGIIYPLAEFSTTEVQSYMDRNGIMSSPEYELGLGGNRSYGGSILGENLEVIKKHFPDDFEKIKKRFPFAEASILYRQMKQKAIEEEVRKSLEMDDLEQ